jgi:uncharacterized protein (TIGR02391 family)
MNLQTQIRDSLWKAIQSTYNTKNYSHAILDAMHYLSNVLRDKSGVDGDGAKLVGQALGGDPPRLRINKFQTETEQNEQRGIESILRGLYQAVRNPRSHEQIKDPQETADAIIHFINYLLSIIEKSEEPFVLSKFLTRVFDSNFVNSYRYAELLVNEVPANKLFDTLIAIYRGKLEGDIVSTMLVIGALINKLSEDQIKQFLAIVSDELSVINEDIEIRYNLKLIPPNLWSRLTEVSKLRIENRVIGSIKEGQVINGVLSYGGLATYARKHFENFTLKDRLEKTFLEKLNSKSVSERIYVIGHFLSVLPIVITAPFWIDEIISDISDTIKDNYEITHKPFVKHFHSLPDLWRKQFYEELKDMTEDEEETSAFQLADGTPFLKYIEYSPRSDDDIPF